jgi:hypothetical protein
VGFDTKFFRANVRRVPLLGFIGILAGLLILIGATGEEQGIGEPTQPPDVVVTVGDRPAAATADALPCTGQNEPPGFRLYSLGSSFDGLPLTTVIRRCDNPSSNGSANYVSYIYGSCEPQGDSGCAPPIEVQVWPSCERTAADYGSGLDLSQRRGVPSAVAGGGIELYTGGSTVVIFAQGQSQAERAADAVQPMSRDGTPASFPPPTSDTEQLPSPPPGAVDGRLRCTEQTS